VPACEMRGARALMRDVSRHRDAVHGREDIMRRTYLAAATGLASSLLQAAPPALDKAMQEWASPEPTPAYRHALTDLDGDGALDAIVLVVTPYYCGSGGCSMVIFKGTAHGFRIVSDATITKQPIYVLPEVKHGWHTIAVYVSGGGAEAGHALLQFDGEQYPGNPSMQKRASPGDIKSARRLTLE
jgi:hypothetical protein